MEHTHRPVNEQHWPAALEGHVGRRRWCMAQPLMDESTIQKSVMHCLITFIC